MIFVWTLSDVIGLILVVLFALMFIPMWISVWYRNRKADKAAAIRSMK
jgi:predicted RND superfamily exporter protein